MNFKNPKSIKIILIITAIGLYSYIYLRDVKIENVIENVKSAIILVFILVAVDYIKLRKEKNLRELVSGVISMRLLDPIAETCYKYDLNKFRITEEEQDFSKIILQDYKKDRADKYFRNALCNISGVRYAEDYFFVSLYSYLEEKQYHIDMFMFDLGLTTGEKKDIFESAFYKMLYVSYFYCNRSKRINPKGNLYYNVKELEKEAFQKIARENA